MTRSLALWIVVAFLAAPAAQSGEWSAGLGIAVGNPYVDGDGVQAIPVPLVTYEGQRFNASPGGVQYTLFENRSLSLRAQSSLRFEGFDDDDTPLLQGLRTRRNGLDAGLSLGYATFYGDLSVEWMRDISGVSQGTEVSLGYQLPLVRERSWSVSLGVAGRWLDRKLVDYYYGVSDAEANTLRAAYRGRDSIGWEVSVDVGRRIAERWHLLGSAGFGDPGSGVRRSPIARDSAVPSGFIGVMRRFGTR